MVHDPAHRQRNTRRLRLYPWGRTDVGRDQFGNSLDFVVDRQFYTDLREFFDDHLNKPKPYLPPFAFAHKPAVDGPADVALLQALTPGWVTELGEDQDGIWGDVYFADGIVELYDKGLLSSISPSHYTNFRNPHTGKVYRRGLREVSAIGVRYLKDLPIQSGYYQFAEGGGWQAITQLEEASMTTQQTQTTGGTSAATHETSAPTLEQIKAVFGELIAPVTQSVTQLAERVDKLPAQTTTTTQLSEQGGEVDKIKALEGEIADLRKKAAIAEHRATLMARLPGADAALVTSLSETLIMAPAQAETQIKALEALHGVEAVKSRTQATTTTILAEQGRTGANTGKVALSVAKREAAAAGIKPGQPQLDWSRNKYGDNLDVNA